MLQVASIPSGWSVTLDPTGKQLRIKSRYEAGGTATIGLELHCAHQVNQAELPVAVRNLRWSPLPTWTPKVDGPKAREHAPLWIDEADPDRLLMFGGLYFEPQQWTVGWDLWSYDLANDKWTELTSATEPPHLATGRVALIPGERAILYSNGADQANQAPYSLKRFDYAPVKLTWSDVPATGAPASGEQLGSLVFDAPRNRYISACGLDGSFKPHCQVKAFYPAESRWELLTVEADKAELPTPRYGFFFAYDAETERLIVFGGAQEPMPGNPVNPAHDTWALELGQTPARWVRLPGPQTPPVGRRNGCFALDEKNHRLITWGGTANGATTVPGLHILDLDRGAERWQTLELPDSPPIRSSCSGVYDAKRNRVLFGFGNSAKIYTDLHALNL
jgi:hypothetical protein